MFAALLSSSSSAAPLVAVAEAFTPRFEALGGVLLLDVRGLARLFGGPAEIGEYIRKSAVASDPGACVAVAPTATAATLLALGRQRLRVVTADDMAPALAALPLSVLREYERVCAQAAMDRQRAGDGVNRAADADRRDPGARTVPGDTPPAGWGHPRQTHQAHRVRRPHRAIADTAAAKQARSDALDVQATLALLARWGLTTLGALASLPAPDVAERLGERGTRWMRLARGEDDRPLVPWVPEAPFEAFIELEWPIEGLEPLSFVLTRLLEPLAVRLERADRGAAIVHLRLGLADKSVHARHVQLPAPMRDPKTLRTLMLLDLESHPPSAGIDRVGVLVEPTPGRVLQWTLFERAQPSPEQMSTLLARLTALMGEGHVGSPALVDAWRPGAFELKAFAMQRAEPALPSTLGNLQAALRRFRLPVPARVRVHEGRPVRVQVDRRGLASGIVVQAAGPWRTSGEWWLGGPPTQPTGPAVETRPVAPAAGGWDRDEWDVALGDGTIYRLTVERAIGQWFIEGVID